MVEERWFQVSFICKVSIGEDRTCWSGLTDEEEAAANADVKEIFCKALENKEFQDFLLLMQIGMELAQQDESFVDWLTGHNITDGLEKLFSSVFDQMPEEMRRYSGIMGSIVSERLQATIDHAHVRPLQVEDDSLVPIASLSETKPRHHKRKKR